MIDADVYGHSIPHMLGIHQRPVVVDKMIVPPVRGAPEVDLDRLLPRRERARDVARADAPPGARAVPLRRALGRARLLVVDMPPGTGDMAISLGQLLPRAEVLVVTTPQPLAQEVAARAAQMAQKTGQRLLGVVENMTRRGLRLRRRRAARASELGVPLLGTVPLDAALREAADAGEPVVESGARLRLRAGDPRVAEARRARRGRRAILKPLTVLT